MASRTSETRGSGAESSEGSEHGEGGEGGDEAAHEGGDASDERRRLKRVVAREALAAATNDLDEDRPSGVIARERPTNQEAPRRGVLRFSRTTRELVSLAWPIAAAMLGETAIGLVDTKLVGGLGAAALGGVGLATTLMFLSYALVFGLMRGVKVSTAHAIGEGRPHHAFVYARAGVLMGAAIGFVVLFACRDVSGLLLAVGTEPSLVPYGRDFLAAVTLGAPSTCALAALIQHRQAIGDSRTPMVVGITGNVFNAIFAWALIYGHLGLPALGVRGGGYATATTESLELLVMLVMLLRDERAAERAGALVDDGLGAPLSLARAARGVAELGVPLGLQFFAEMLAFATFTAVLGSIGEDEIAAHQIALNVIRVSFLPGVAVAEAASVLVGQALGARSLRQADATVKSALGVAVGFMALCGAAFALFGGAIAELFSRDPAVTAITRRLLLVAAIFQVLDAVNIVLRGSLRGAKDVRVVAFMGIAIIWTCVPTSAYLLGKHMGLGALGGWLGFIGETTLSAALFWLRWKNRGWRAQYMR
jgi:MATE family multidrug resistance protein